MRTLLHIILLAVVFCFSALSQTNEQPKKSAAQAGRELRLRTLTTQPAQLGQKPTSEHPRVAGVIMDFPIKTATASIVSLSSGDASIYTTGTFGVIGGFAHETVRSGAINFVTVCEKHFDEATLTKDYPYPAAGRVRFYLICYDGVRVIDADLESLSSGKDKDSDLLVAGMRVWTEFRKVVQKQEKGTQP
jgi:hypothetical protein